MARTVIYYTSNIEDEFFENKVRQNILDCKGDLPLISVSQKPIDFGDNICVGDVGWSYQNAFLQLLIGCEKATTPYVVMAESDCFYPKVGYFDYIPENLNVIYTYTNVWILYGNRNRYYHKKQTHGSLIYPRGLLIDLLRDALKGLSWSRKRIKFPFFQPKHRFKEFTGTPIINVVTGANGRKGTFTTGETKKELEYWGLAKEMRKGIFNE